jgi:hypothetical protein
MYVNSKTLSLLASESLNAAFHIQTCDCRIIADTSSILIETIIYFHYELTFLVSKCVPYFMIIPVWQCNY